MTDGSSAANREERLVDDVERAAEALDAALRATGGPIFMVHPAAVQIANELLEKSGYELVKVVALDLEKQAKDNERVVYGVRLGLDIGAKECDMAHLDAGSDAHPGDTRYRLRAVAKALRNMNAVDVFRARETMSCSKSNEETSEMAMDLNRVKQVCEFYIARLAKWHNDSTWVGKLPEQALYLLNDFLPRLVKMIDEEPERREKIMRWYGYAQGVLVALDFFSVDEVKDHSRPDAPPPAAKDAPNVVTRELSLADSPADLLVKYVCTPVNTPARPRVDFNAMSEDETKQHLNKLVNSLRSTLDQPLTTEINSNWNELYDGLLRLYPNKKDSIDQMATRLVWGCV